MATDEEEFRCPACGQPYNESMVVGKTQTFHRGIRTTYEVVICICGKTFRGRMIEEKELPKREPRRSLKR